MPRSRSRVRESNAQIEAMIKEQGRRKAILDRANAKLTGEAIEDIRFFSPRPGHSRGYSRGRWVAGIHAVKLHKTASGLPGRRILPGNQRFARWIEYGTKPDKPDSKSPWGPNTPTPAFAPFGKTKAKRSLQ